MRMSMASGRPRGDGFLHSGQTLIVFREAPEGLGSHLGAVHPDGKLAASGSHQLGIEPELFLDERRYPSGAW